MFTRNRMPTPVVIAISLVVAHVVIGALAIWINLGRPDRLSEEPLFTLVYVPFVVMGAVVLAKHPRNPVGWLLVGVGFGANLGILVQEYAIRATVTAPGSLPLGAAFAWVSYWIWNVSLMCLFFAVLLFPTGRAASPRWRPLGWAAGVLFAFVTFVFAFAPAAPVPTGLVNPFTIEALRPVGVWVEDSFWIFLVMFGLAVASVIARFRASRGVVRQQLKWAAGGCAFAGVLLAISNYGPSPVSDLGWVLALPAIPVSLAIAMLRYRLYDIDLLINRALVYGAVSATLLGAYVLLVLSLGALLRPVTGSSDLTVAGSTLAVVALFQPLRAWIQRFVDRRFYRARYDASRTVDQFSSRLREQVDLDQLSGELIAVIDDTVKPAHASLWLRGGR